MSKLQHLRKMMNRKAKTNEPPECTRQYMRMASKFSTQRFAFCVSPVVQKGAVLIITLLVLLILTVIAVAQISFNTTQTFIATNSADTQIAFETAEGALNEATNNLLANTYSNSSFLSNSNGLYLLDATQPALWTTINWESPNAVILSFQGKSKAKAAYFIEQLPSIIKPGQNMNFPANVYRITARAVSASGNTAVILQSTEQIQQ